MNVNYALGYTPTESNSTGTLKLQSQAGEARNKLPLGVTKSLDKSAPGHWSVGPNGILPGVADVHARYVS